MAPSLEEREVQEGEREPGIPHRWSADFYFWCLLGCFFGGVFGLVFGVHFFALEHVQDVFGAQHGTLLGAKMAPKSLQDGLEDG